MPFLTSLHENRLEWRECEESRAREEEKEGRGRERKKNGWAEEGDRENNERKVGMKEALEEQLYREREV